MWIGNTFLDIIEFLKFIFLRSHFCSFSSIPFFYPLVPESFPLSIEPRHDFDFLDYRAFFVDELSFTSSPNKDHHQIVMQIRWQFIGREIQKI